MKSLMNDNYKLLCCLNEHIVTVGKDKFIPLTQQEISRLMHFSLMKINRMMIDLKINGFIKAYNNTKGRYILTDKAMMVIKEIAEIDKKISKEIK